MSHISPVDYFINVLGITVIATEVALLISKRAKGEQDIVTDDKSLRMICRTIGTGIGLTYSNHIVGIIALTLPVFWVISKRISIEEKSMESFFGVEYVEFRKRTKKLIPYIY